MLKMGIGGNFIKVLQSMYSQTKYAVKVDNRISEPFLSSVKCEPKSGLSCRRQVVHPRPQTSQGESVAKLETPLLVIRSIGCKLGPWQHVQPVIRKAKSADKTS